MAKKFSLFVPKTNDHGVDPKPESSGSEVPHRNNIFLQSRLPAKSDLAEDDKSKDETLKRDNNNTNNLIETLKEDIETEMENFPEQPKVLGAGFNLFSGFQNSKFGGKMPEKRTPGVFPEPEAEKDENEVEPLTPFFQNRETRNSGSSYKMSLLIYCLFPLLLLNYRLG